MLAVAVETRPKSLAAEDKINKLIFVLATHEIFSAYQSLLAGRS